MRAEQFDKILEERIEKIKSTLQSKAGEYAADSNRLHNFDSGARIEETTPEKVLWGFFLKHFISVQDMVESEETYPEEYIDEKIGDIIFYMILLEAIMKRSSDWKLMTGEPESSNQ